MSQGNGIQTRAARSKTRYLGVGNDVLMVFAIVLVTKVHKVG